MRMMYFLHRMYNLLDGMIEKMPVLKHQIVLNKTTLNIEEVDYGLSYYNNRRACFCFFWSYGNIFFQRSFDVKQKKVELISSILGCRYQLTDSYNGEISDILHNLNQILLVFYKSKKVIDALRRYQKGLKPDDFSTLIILMCNDIKIEYDITENLICNPFCPRKS